MWRTFTDKFALIVLGALLAGCSGTSLVQDSSGSKEMVDAPEHVKRSFRSALEKVEANDDAAAAGELEQFIARYPDYPGAYVNLAIVYDRQERTDEAVWLLNRAIEADADYVYAYNRLGLIKRRQGAFDDAEAAWLEAVKIDPDYSYGWYNLGVLYDLYLQDLSAALVYYQRYQQLMGLSGEKDPVVARWITDLERRIGQLAQANNVEGMR